MPILVAKAAAVACARLIASWSSAGLAGAVTAGVADGKLAMVAAKALPATGCGPAAAAPVAGPATSHFLRLRSG